MAKLSAHGTELYRRDGLTCKTAYMDDGAILKNFGTGWKLYGKVKSGVTPEQAAANVKSLDETLVQRRPAFHAYKRLLHELVGTSHRAQVVAGLEILSNDPDGLWSELDDAYEMQGELSIDDVVQLCRAYESASAESKANRLAKVAV